MFSSFLGVEHDFGDLSLDIGNKLFHELCLELLLDIGLSVLKHISLDALLELVDVIVIKILRELIVELGKLLDLYLVKSDLESGILARKLGSVLLGELDIDVEALACVRGR